MENMTLQEYIDLITVDYGNSPRFVTYDTQANAANILSLTVKNVMENDIVWFSSLNDCYKNMEHLIGNDASSFSDVLIDANANNASVPEFMMTDIAKNYIARQAKRGVGNTLIDEKYMVYTTKKDHDIIDGPFMMVVDGERYGIATNHGIHGTSGYIVDIKNQ